MDLFNCKDKNVYGTVWPTLVDVRQTFTAMLFVVSVTLVQSHEPAWSVHKIIVQALTDILGGNCADLSTSMKFDTDVDQNIYHFLRAPKPMPIGATIFAKSKMAACRFLIQL